ncbi:unnamed protein product [Trifolium pratense]|uniref:Uncharacterized protein n=1 Tax=Trifolium pratense TaxID=57577 RepID=A0ACB0K7I8_TRIPR|nr:unnamed protein product [Trifolium pratense]
MAEWSKAPDSSSGSRERALSTNTEKELAECRSGFVEGFFLVFSTVLTNINFLYHRFCIGAIRTMKRDYDQRNVGIDKDH